jgi:hypothetical protein
VGDQRPIERCLGCPSGLPVDEPSGLGDH